MNRSLRLIVMATLLTLSSMVAAEELDWSCDDMKKFVVSMHEGTAYLADKPNFGDNPKIAQDIDVIIKALKIIAADEAIPTFSAAVKRMSSVWNKEEWSESDVNAFRSAMKEVSNSLEGDVYKKYCSQ